jgi:hypothetical protein
MRTVRSALLLACATLLLTPTIATASQAEDPKFLAEPAEGSSTEPRGSYFVVAASAGSEFTQSVALRNDSPSPIDLRLAAVDAGTAQRGGTSFGLESETPSQAGTWVVLERTSLTLAAGESALVGFKVTVPADATSGVHLAGISVLSPTQAAGADGAEAKAGASITVQSRRVIAVQVDLPGPADPELVITGVAPIARPDGLYLEVAVDNRGRGLTKGEGDLTLPGENFASPLSIETFVPGTSIAYPVKWADSVSDGERDAHVEIRYGDRVAVWDGKFRVGEEVRDELANRQVDPPAPVPSSGGSPVLLVLGGVLGAVVLLGGGIILGRRSKEQSPAPTPTGS